MLTGIVANRRDPVGEINRMADEFHSSSAGLRIGLGDEHAERMRELIADCVDVNFEAIRGRVVRAAELEAAQVERKN